MVTPITMQPRGALPARPMDPAGRAVSPGAAGTAVYALVAWVCLLSFPHGLPLPTLDQSWAAMVTQAAAEHWHFGSQILLTHGPLGYLGMGFYHPDLFTAAYVFQIVSRLVIVALFCRMGRALPQPGCALFFAASIGVGVLDWEAIQLWAIVCAAWLMSEDRSRTGRLVGFAGLALAAAAALMKVYFLVFALGALGCVVARELSRRPANATRWRDAMVPPTAFTAFFAAAWLFSGQRASDLPTYLYGSWQVMDGHSRAMGFDPPATVLCLGLVIAGWLAVLGTVSLLRTAPERRATALPLVALFAGTIFMAWKQGYTRADNLHVAGFLCDACIGVTLWPLFFGRRALTSAVDYPGIVVIWVLSWYGMTTASGTPGRTFLSALWKCPAHNLVVLFHPSGERARLDAAVANLRLQYALPHVRAVVGHARIDVFGTIQTVALLNDLNFAPTPVVQSYLAYTPYLADLVAHCYTPDRAPEFVLFERGSLDTRLPWLDGALQERELLWHYAPVLLENDFLLLRRKPPAAQVPMSPVLSASGQLPLGAPLDVPAANADWCELEIRPTLLGKFINVLYHETPPRLEITTLDGTRTRWQLPTLMAQGGFLLRNGPQSWTDIACLLVGRPVPNPVVSIRLLDSPLTRWSFQPRVAYRFYHLDPVIPVPHP